MSTIICRHTNATIFDYLSHNKRYDNASSLCYVANGNLEMVNVVMDNFSGSIEWDEKHEKAHLYWYKANKSGIKTPHKVLKDVKINDKCFISLCGHVCYASDYEKTKEKHDVTQIVKDICLAQPRQGHMSSFKNENIKNKFIHWNDIPTDAIFHTYQGRSWDFGVMHRHVGKHFRGGEMHSRDIDPYKLCGKICPYVEDGVYENINFYEDDATWYNPGKKFVELNHAVTHENFFDKDGFLCSIWNYEYVPREHKEMYYKKFLFLV